MTPSKTPSTVDKSANPDRRGGRRAPVIETCFYQLTHFPGHEIVEFSDGHALSLNTSPEGFLLLMPQSPERGQVFEVHTPVSTEERNREEKRTVKLVEACWTRELTFGAADKVYLVGVRSLFEPTRPN
ncbi:MAG: hypothetical protein EWM73_01392 [Nitrospira sp.]|nr:MAG: hypothetical protein EWM73_01392 [Nitrospira sp.]